MLWVGDFWLETRVIIWFFHEHFMVWSLCKDQLSRGIDLAQPIWSSSCPTKGEFTAKNAFLVFFACFRPYIGQPADDHIGWAISMPFASIDLFYPKTNPWNFREKYWELMVLKNSILKTFFQTFFFFASSQWKSVKGSLVARMSRNHQPQTFLTQVYLNFILLHTFSRHLVFRLSNSNRTEVSFLFKGRPCSTKCVFWTLLLGS